MKIIKNRATILVNFLLIIGLSQFMASCSEEVDLKLENGFIRLVVDAQLSTDTTKHLVTLRTTSSYFVQQNPPVVSGAIVKISDGNSIITLNEIPLGSGNYYTDSTFFGLIGKSYTLTIEEVDVNDDGKKEKYQATDRIFPSWQMDSTVAVFKERKDGTKGYEVLGYGTEPGGRSDCYMWQYYINGKLMSDTLFKTALTDDRFFDGIYLPGVSIFGFIEGKPGDTLTIETQAVSRNFYDFIFALFTESFYGGGGLLGPPANVPSNLNQSALGYFKTYSSTKNTYILPKLQKK